MSTLDESNYVIEYSDNFNKHGDDCLLYRYNDNSSESNCPFYGTEYCREECPWNEGELS